MELKLSQPDDLLTLSSWFDTESDVRDWGGPLIRFPIILEQLKADIKWENATSFSLVNSEELLGFVQIFDRYGCHHLSRVAINPKMRNKGLGLDFMKRILAANKHPIKAHSLFVYKHNIAASQLYKKLGFKACPYPKGQGRIEDCLFMMRKVSL